VHTYTQLNLKSCNKLLHEITVNTGDNKSECKDRNIERLGTTKNEQIIIRKQQVVLKNSGKNAIKPTQTTFYI
jgi:ribosome biogenesis protein Tsr3